MTLPNTLIIGSQKSSTTFVQFVLGHHPDCFVEKNENRFFEDPDYNGEDLSILKACFDSAEHHAIRVLKRPTYFTRLETAERIKLHIPNAKLILSLRAPVDRAIAAYFHYMRYRLIDYAEVNSGMARIFASMEKGVTSVETDVLEYGLYHKYLSIWSEVFAADQIFAFSVQEISNPEGAKLLQLFEFLGIDPIGIPDLTPNEKNSGFYSVTGMRLIRAANFIKLKLYDGGKSTMRRRSASFSTPIWFFLQKAAFLIEKNNIRRPLIDPVLRQELASFYQEDLDMLKIDFGISFE